MFSNVSSFNQGVDLAFAIIIGFGLIFLIGMTFTMIYFIVKYNKKRHPKPVDVKDNPKLELAWIIIPTILVLIMFWFGYLGYKPTRQVPDDAMVVKVTGMKWKWLFDYENGVSVRDTMVVPVGKAVKLDLYSPDVLHSFYVPAFRIKEDVVPGKDNWMWFRANEIGEYDILCAEYCGTDHAYMLGRLRVLSKEDYDKWYSDPSLVPADAAHPGFEVFKSNACMGCHSTDGSKMTGPTLKGLFGSTRKVVKDGQTIEVTADYEYLKRSIYNPNDEIVEGYPPVMADYSKQISVEDLKLLIDYIESLK